MPAFVQNSNVLQLLGTSNSLTAEYINDATVEVTVLDSAGNEVAGETWPKAMPYVPDSAGIYRCTLSASLALVARQVHCAKIDLAAGDGLAASWRFLFRPQERTQ